MEKRHVLRAPAWIHVEFGQKSCPLVQILIAPQFQHLVEWADLCLPATFKLAIIVLADFQRYGAQCLHHFGQRTLPYG